eukprot:7814869-Alexandrium_andersonii.AAC.1
MLGLPFELAHAFRHGCETLELGGLSDLPPAVIRRRGIPEVPEGFGIRFPLDVDRALLEAAGLQADLVALLWG